MTKLKQPNYHNLFGTRKLKYSPAHLSYTTIPMSYNLEKAVDKWIYSNLKKRYYIGKGFAIGNAKKHPNSCLKVGFEDPKELSYFILACPLLKYN